MQTWQEANQHYMAAAIAPIRRTLQQHSKQSSPSEPDSLTANDYELSTHAWNTPPALESLCQCFDLSPFERAVVLLCAGIELQADWGQLCAAAGPPYQPVPTFGLAQQVLASSHWSAFLPTGALRHWQIIEVGPSNALLTSPLRLSERILHELLGFPNFDNRLTTLVSRTTSSGPLVPSHQHIAGQMMTAWHSSDNNRSRSVIQLCGIDRPSMQAIAISVCQAMRIVLYTLSSQTLPLNPNELQQFTRLWERENQIRPVALLIDWEVVSGTEPARIGAIELLLNTLQSPLILLSRDRRSLDYRPLITYEIQTPTREEQIQLWHHHLGDQATMLKGFAPTLAGQFDLSSHQIQSASLQAMVEVEQAGSGSEGQGVVDEDEKRVTVRLWEACRVQTRLRLDELAQRLTPRETWQDLVLPDRETASLQEIVAHVQQRSQVHDVWGFGRQSNRGLGISALFAGSSGTGKTMAANVLGQTLRLDVYRIDLSSIVSKYIGETEKNLRRIFDAAESGGVILLFDEADALFGKRSDVKDSRDRYANMEVSYLLQRMESYRGLAILTTNLKDSIDAAFLRRIRFIVRFPFPDFEQRIRIWQRMFPSTLPTADLDFRKLARLNVAGGNIRNIALTAAFFAATEGGPLSMAHLLRATQSEYSKLERPIPPAEVRGWVTGAGSLKGDS